MKMNKKGFTLVECIVAIAVILLISSVALTTYMSTLRTTNSQWDYYEATLQAQNGLACFQTSENFDVFNGRFNALNQADDLALESTYQISGAEYDQQDLNDQMIPVPFGKVRTYENKDGHGGLVQLLRDDGTSVADLAYSGALSGSGDASALQNAALYQSAPEYETKQSWITYTASAQKKGSGSEQDRSRNRYDYTKISATYDLTVNITEQKIKIESKVSAENGNITSVSGWSVSPEKTSATHSREYAPNDVEKNLLAQGQFLYFDKNCASGTYADEGYLYCYVYDVQTKTYAKENGKYIIYRIKGKKYKDFRGNTYSWYNSNGYFVVSKVEKVLASSLPRSYSQFPTWGYSSVSGSIRNWFFPAYVCDCCYFEEADHCSDTIGVKYNNRHWERESKNPSLTVKDYMPYFADNDGYCGTLNITGEVGGKTLLYTDYTFQEGKTADILYARSDGSTFVKLYNSQNELLFSYTGSGIAGLLPMVQNCGFDTTRQKEGETEITYYKQLNIGIPSRVVFDDAAMKIHFCNAMGSHLVSFTFADATQYGDAKESITVANYQYGAYYRNATAAGALIQYEARTIAGVPYSRTGTMLRQVGEEYQLIDQLKVGEDETITQIFGTTHASQVVIVVDGEEKTPQLNKTREQGVMATATSQTKYYKYSNGVYGCLMRVTYANTVYDTATEPKYKAWVMRASDLALITPDVIAGLASTDEVTQYRNVQRFESGLGDADIDYRKG